MIFLVEAGAGGDGDVDGQPLLERADHFLNVGKSQVARAADGDDGVIDPLPDRLITEEGRGEQFGHEIFRAIMDVAFHVRRPAIFQHLGTGVAAVEAADIGEGKLDEAPLADDLREGLRGLRQQLVHEMKAVADIFHRGGIVRDPVVGKDEDAVGFPAQVGDGIDRFFAAQPALKGEGLHAHHDDLRARLAAQADQMLRQGHAGRTAEAEHENEEITTAGDRGEPVLLQGHHFAGQFEIAAAAEPVHEVAPQQVPVRDDGAFNRQLIRVENPEVLAGPPMQHQLVTDGGSRLAEAKDAHASGEKLVGFFREGSICGEFDHGFNLRLAVSYESHVRQRTP